MYECDPERAERESQRLEEAAYGGDVRARFSFRCRIPLLRQRRGCGLNAQIASSKRADEVFDQLASAGVSEVSLAALARRLNPDT